MSVADEVRIAPGLSVFDVTPVPASAFARLSDMFVFAAFVAA